MPPKQNPFVVKAQRRQRAHAISLNHYTELRKLLARYTDDDDPQARARIAARTEEARLIVVADREAK